MATVVIRGGTVVDGTGGPPFVADVAIQGRTITAIGPDLPVRGAREVDARGLLVTPGWVDPHTHYDAQVMWDPYLSPSSGNGVTSVVMGNCGVSLAPCPEKMRPFLMDLADSVEDIPRDSIKEAVRWEWESYPEYVAALEKMPFACDVGVFVGHSAVRTWVMGSRANVADRPGGRDSNAVSAEDIANMSKVVEEAIAAGALGVSSSRVSIHRDPAGVLLPGTLASAEEVLALGGGVVRGGGGVFELASTWDCYDDVPTKDEKKVAAYQQQEWRMLDGLSKIDPEKLSITTGLGTGMTPETAWAPFRMFLKRMDQINAAGGSMMGTPMMRMGGLNFSVASGIHPFAVSKTYRRLLKDGGAATIAQQMQDPATRSSIISEAMQFAEEKKGHPAMGLVEIVTGSADFVFPWSSDYEPRREDSLQERAKREGTTIWELAYGVLAHPEAKHGGVLWRALYNYGTHDMEPLLEMLKHDKVVPGFADGGAHMKMMCDATVPTTMLTHWVRDRSRGQRLPVEFVVRKQTAAAAEMLGLSDRGTLRPGMKADINVIDLDRLTTLPPTFVTDLPLGAGRWVQGVRGYRMTVLSGVVTYENDVATGALPGRLLKNPRSTGRHGGLKGSVPPAADAALIDGPDLTAHAMKLASEHAGASAIGKTVNAAVDAPSARL